ncbi:hypothetical protein HKX48_002995 [Thoreauomyces humboldtii]|nr:hypothetical protein HKX48_002995 [Thoreauomyces humboldtii]
MGVRERGGAVTYLVDDDDDVEEGKVTFLVDDVEVIGFGGETAREQQARAWSLDEREAARRGGVDLRAAGGDEGAKMVLSMAGVAFTDY